MKTKDPLKLVKIGLRHARENYALEKALIGLMTPKAKKRLGKMENEIKAMKEFIEEHEREEK